MTIPVLDPPTRKIALNAVLCGSFRRNREGLVRAHATLNEAFTLLSPRALDFVDPAAEFVRLPEEVGESARAVEDRHLRAIERADFVWLHAPDGYVGTSAALEVGHARALGIPVFSSELPVDETLREYVVVLADPTDAPDALRLAPGRGLTALQHYYRRVSERRGWSDESAQDTLLLLTEELGELARAVRKATGLRRDGAYPKTAVEQELADVQLYLIHLANTLGVDIAEAVTAKEGVNARRFAEHQRVDVA